ncbi:MAG: cache domain-containing protein, partial [Victivallaceae bacterium]
MSQKHTHFFLEWGKAHLTASVLVIFAVWSFFAWWIVNLTDNQARADLLQQARLVARAINGEQIQRLSGTEADLASKDYQQLKEHLISARSANPQCRFIYLFGRKPDGSVFFFMNSEPAGSDDYSPPGQVYKETSAECLSVFDSGIAIIEGTNSDRWGTWISALVPVINPKTGALLAVLGMDVNVSTWKLEIAAKVALPLGLMLVLLIMVSFALAASRADTSPKPVIRRLLPSMAVIVVLLMAGAGMLLWQQHQQNLAETTTADVADVAGDMQMALERPFGLIMAAQTIAADPGVQKAMREGDADCLLATWRPVCEMLRRQNNLTHFYFFDKSRVCLLRVHNPGLRGGQVDRFTLLEAERTGRTATGIELGVLGTLTFRVVQPVFENGKIVGYVELGKEIDEVLQSLHTRFGIQLAVAIHKKYLNQKNWEAGMRLLGRDANWNRLTSNVVTYASQGTLPDAFALWLERSVAKRSNVKARSEIALDGKTWQVFAMPLPDASGKEVGNLLIMRDVTLERAAFARLLILGGTAGGVLLALLLSFIYVLLLRTDRNIRFQQMELMASRRQLKDIIEFLPDATLAIDKEKRVIIWNMAIEKMTGIPAAEMIGRGDYAYTIPFYGEARKQLMDLVFADNQELLSKYSCITREGDTITAEAFCNALYNNKGGWVLLKVSPLHDQHGNIIGAIESIHDITSRKQAADRLRSSEEMMRYIIKHDP